MKMNIQKSFYKVFVGFSSFKPFPTTKFLKLVGEGREGGKEIRKMEKKKKAF